MAIVVPADPIAVRKLLPKIVEWQGPVFFRLCRNEVPQIFSDVYEPEIGKGIVLREGTDVTILCCGVMIARALLAASELAEQGVRARVVEMHTIKPLDIALVLQCARETGALVTVEEHSIIGGLGGAVAEVLIENEPVPMERVGIADTFAESGPYSELMDKYGLSVNDIVNAVRRAIGRKTDDKE
jgi:transketolase